MKNPKAIYSLILGAVMMVSGAAHSQMQDPLVQKSMKAAQVLKEIATAPDKTIPASLFKRATCVATIPDVVKAGFIFGGKFGQGLVSCRTATGWSTPSYLKVIGGSWGFEIGVSAVDTVLVFVSDNAVKRLSENNFTLGGNASVAAGPVGRDLQAGTDYQLNTEILSYSRSRGLFAGIALEGTSVSVDTSANKKMYGGELSAESLLNSSGHSAPAGVVSYVTALETYAP